MTSLEAPVQPADATPDVYNPKLQVGAEQSIPVVALDVPVAEVSPLAGHFSAFDQEESSSAASGPSALPVVDEPAPRIGEEGATDATCQRKDVLHPVAAVDEARRSEATFAVSATGNSTLDNDAAVGSHPSSGAKETATSAGVGVCSMTEAGIADTTADFGAVDLSALMAEDVAEKVSPDVESSAQPPANSRGPRHSLSPGMKAYAIAKDPSVSPKAAGVTGAADEAGVPLQALPGDAEGRAGAADRASSPPNPPVVDVDSADKKDCVIS